MDDSYKSIAKLSEGLYREKGSRFLSFAIPVDSLEEVKELLKDYRKRYHDARHLCYAYMLGPERKDFRCSDDGEPSGTAGRPILGQINSAGLTNLLLIVTRYFGGVLLGTGGLVVAYKEAAADAIRHAHVVEKRVDCRLHIKFEYPLMNDVMRVVKELDACVVGQGFDEACILELSVRKRDFSLLSDKLLSIEGIRLLEN